MNNQIQWKAVLVQYKPIGDICSICLRRQIDVSPKLHKGNRTRFTRLHSLNTFFNRERPPLLTASFLHHIRNIFFLFKELFWITIYYQSTNTAFLISDLLFLSIWTRKALLPVVGGKVKTVTWLRFNNDLLINTVVCSLNLTYLWFFLYTVDLEQHVLYADFKKKYSIQSFISVDAKGWLSLELYSDFPLCADLALQTPVLFKSQLTI